MSRWLPTRWWRREGAHSWRPGDQRRAAWGQHRPRQRCPEVPHNPEANRSSESRSLLMLDRKRFTSLLWECQHWLRGPANCRKPLQRCRPPPSDCSRCTCPGWTYWTIKQSNTLIYFKVTLCLDLKDPQRKPLYYLVGLKLIKSKVWICFSYVLYVHHASMINPFRSWELSSECWWIYLASAMNGKIPL